MFTPPPQFLEADKIADPTKTLETPRLFLLKRLKFSGRLRVADWALHERAAGLSESLVETHKTETKSRAGYFVPQSEDKVLPENWRAGAIIGAYSII